MSGSAKVDRACGDDHTNAVASAVLSGFVLGTRHGGDMRFAKAHPAVSTENVEAQLHTLKAGISVELGS